MDCLAQDAQAASEQADDQLAYDEDHADEHGPERDEHRAARQGVHRFTLDSVLVPAAYPRRAAEAKSRSSVPSAITRSPSSSRRSSLGLTCSVPSSRRTARTLAASGASRPDWSMVLPTAF